MRRLSPPRGSNRRSLANSFDHSAVVVLLLHQYQDVTLEYPSPISFARAVEYLIRETSGRGETKEGEKAKPQARTCALRSVVFARVLRTSAAALCENNAFSTPSRLTGCLCEYSLVSIRRNRQISRETNRLYFRGVGVTPSE